MLKKISSNFLLIFTRFPTLTQNAPRYDVPIRHIFNVLASDAWLSSPAAIFSESTIWFSFVLAVFSQSFSVEYSMFFFHIYEFQWFGSGQPSNINRK